MSSISPSGSDSGLAHYYHKVVNDLENDVQAEARKNRKMQQEQIEALENRYREALQKKDEEHTEAVQNIKENSNQVIRNERERYQSALEEYKDGQKSNRGGADFSAAESSGLGNYYHKVFNDIRNEVDAEAKRNRIAHEEQLHRMEEAQRDALLTQEREATETIRNVKSDANDALRNEREQFHAEREDLKAQIYNSRGQISESVPLEIHKKLANDLSKDIEFVREKSSRDLADREDALHHQLVELREKSDDQINRLTEKQIQEVRDYDQRTKSLNNFTNEAAKEQAEKLAELTREHESSQRAQIRKLDEAYTSALNKNKLEIEAKDDYYQRRGDEVLRGKEEYYTGVIRDQNLKHREENKQLESTYQKQIEELNKQREIQAQRADEALVAELHEANEARAKALESQAKSYQDTIKNNQESSQSQIEALQKVLNNRKSEDADTSLISPAAENSVRKSLIREYEKTLNTEVEKNKTAYDHLQRKYAQEALEIMDDNASKLTKVNQQNAQDQAVERAQYVDSMYEIEDHAKTEVREGEIAADRERENMYRHFANSLDRQKRGYEHAFDSFRFDAESKLMDTHQNAQNNLKLTVRTLNARQNEIIRDYEKQLANQKTESDFIIDELKSQAKMDLREVEQRSRKELEQQAANYEQRIAQLEAQRKERERAMSESFQNEIDRTRRSYELLAKKKS